MNPRFDHDDFEVALLAHRYRGAEHHHAVICAGVRGSISTRHGAPDRFDWGVTVASLEAAQRQHERMQKLADNLTPEQREALWGATDEWAVKLRRFVQ